MNVAVISLGSNIDAQRNIDKALSLLKQYFEVNTVSSLIKTEPIGITDQPEFLNGALKISTSMQRDELNKLLKQIEDEMGRDREAPKFGPRIIDLDIVVWNTEIVDNDYYDRSFLRDAVDEVLSAS